MQSFYSRVLGPLTALVFWAVPALLILGIGAELARMIRSHRRR